MILFMFMGLLPYVWDKSRLRRANDGLASHTRMQLITQHADTDGLLILMFIIMTTTMATDFDDDELDNDDVNATEMVFTVI